jgi:predicted MFS family arabinose efflux permease
MLIALSAGGLLCTATTIGISPFLLDIARDLGTDLAAAGNLVALQSVSWGIASLFVGAASDRLGRPPLLVLGMLTLFVSGVGVVTSESYPAIVAWRLLGGFGGGSYMGTVFATVSDHFPVTQRGRSLGWVVTGQSLALVVGVPVVTLVGAVAGWRGAVLGHALVVLVCAGVVWFVVPRRHGSAHEQPLPFRSLGGLIGPRLLALLFAGSTERVCYAAVAVFLPTYLLSRYGVDPPALALGLGLVATGNLVGNLVGGQLSDRLPAPQMVAGFSLAVAGALALPILSWSPGVWLSIVLGFVYMLVNAAGRPALLTVLSRISSDARGAVLGLNITFSSFGWIGATALGGFVVGLFGFAGLAFLTFGFGLLGAGLALATWLAPRREPNVEVALLVAGTEHGHG